MKTKLLTQDAYETAFYLAQNATTIEELKTIEAMINALTPDEDERAALLNVCLERTEILLTPSINGEIKSLKSKNNY